MADFTPSWKCVAVEFGEAENAELVGFWMQMEKPSISKADADLVEAAPAMYEALEAFIVAAESWHNFHNHTDIQCDSLCACIAPGKLALARADGKVAS